jgi:uncharacterized protein YbjT (DUF2867 family)
VPVIVVGADTSPGRAIVEALLERAGEVRAFVSDPAAAADLKDRGVKVAVGDVSDPSHVGSAALHAFSAVAVAAAARDRRSRAFADDPADVLETWGRAFADAGVHRVIYVDDRLAPRIIDVFRRAAPEAVTVDTRGRSDAETAARVAALDDIAALPE